MGRLLQLGALSAFAVGQPLLGLLEDFPGFLVAQRCAPVDVVLIALTLLLAPPLVLFAFTRAIGFASRRAGLVAHGACVALLVSLIVLQLIGRMSESAPALAILAAAVLGVLVAQGVHRSAFLSAFIELCSLGVLGFLVLFLADPDIRTLVFRAEPPVVEAPRIREKMPVVVVIFDELPLSSLLAADGRIDRQRFPAFARLADHSTWFRNATAVAGYTQQAVPAILTGRYPGTKPRLALASEHPHNLFSLLAGSHDLNVFESQMQLSDPDLLPRPSFARRLRPIFDDLFVVYLHLVLPPSLAEDLPPVNRTWKDFAGAASPATGSEEADGSTGESRFSTHPDYFRRFVSSIEEHPEASLHFIHSTLPHRPWRYTPSGQTYFPYREYGLSARFRTTSGDWWQQEACQRHLLQLQFVDRLLGELLDRLDELGLYESSLIVLAADHGVAFWPDDNARFLGLTRHPEDILSIPLLVKVPNQSQGFVDDRNVETVDILPTIADLVGADIAAGGDGSSGGFEFDGCSLYDVSCEQRPDKVAFWSVHPKPETMEELRFDRMIGLDDTGLRKKLAWFGAGLYRFGPHAELTGRRLEGLVAEGEIGGNVALDPAGIPGSRDPSEEGFAPVRISGVLELAREPESTPHVAVAMGGVIQTVVPAPVDGAAGRRVLAMIPESALAAGTRPRLFLVEGPPEQPRLMPLELR